jgi:hypothetical protein
MPNSGRIAARGSAIFTLVVAVLAAGCGTRTVRETIYDDGQTGIVLRKQTRGGEVIDPGYSHPLAIAPVRLAHILSRIDIRTDTDDGSERLPALPTESLYVLADHLAVALGRADSTEEIAVSFIVRDKRWGVFDQRFLYSFITYAKGETLYIHLSRIAWEIPKTADTRKERLPEPRIGDFPMEFRVIPTTAMTPVDAQSLAVVWRDPVFSKPTRTSVGLDGKVLRRTILMETPEETEVEVEEKVVPTVLPETLAAATLRALADLEEERGRGEITEAQYNERRREIIRNDPASKAGTQP